MSKKGGGKDPISVGKFLKDQGYNNDQIRDITIKLNKSYGGADLTGLYNMMTDENSGNAFYFNDNDVAQLTNTPGFSLKDNVIRKLEKGLSIKNLEKNISQNNNRNPNDSGVRVDNKNNVLQSGEYLDKSNYYGGGVIPKFPTLDIYGDRALDPSLVPGKGFKDKTVAPKRTGGGGVSPKKSRADYVNNAPPMDSNGNIDYQYMQLMDEANMKLLQDQRAEIEAMMELERDNSYAPDNQLPDIGGTLKDVGRAALGFAGTQEELPTYTPSAAMSEYIDDARRMKNVGLSSEEENLREQYAKGVYDADVQNIRRLSGGSASTALSNIGSASKRYHNALAETAAMDEMVRRQSMDRFGQAAGQAENIKRLQHGEARQEAIWNKEGAGQLMNDALTNMQERSDFNKYYGKGSQHYEMLKENTLDIRHSRQDRDEARKMQLQTLKNDFDRDILNLEYKNNGAGSLKYRNPDGTATDYVANNNKDWRNDKNIELLKDAYAGEGIGKVEGDRFRGDVVYRTGSNKTDNDIFQVASKITDPEKATAYVLDNNPHEKALKAYVDSDEYDKFDDASNKKLEELRQKSLDWETKMIERITSKK